MAKRNSNIEMLRIVCMLFIVMHHCVCHGNIYSDGNLIIGSLFMPIGKIVFCAFIAITAWYTTDGNFNGRKFLSLWLEVLFYNIFMNCISMLISGGGYKQIVGGLFPILGNSHGFAVAYMVFLLILPLLQHLGKYLNLKNIIGLLIVFFGIQIANDAILRITDSVRYVVLANEIQVFITIWLTCLLIKKTNMVDNIKNHTMIIALILIYVAMVVSWAYQKNHANGISSLMSLFYMENAPQNIVAGILIVLLVKRIPEFSNTIINKLASCTFGVLLFHDNNYFRFIIWKDIVKTGGWLDDNTILLLFEVVFFSLIVYIVGTLLELMRQKINKRIEQTKLFDWCASQLQEFFEINDCRK